MCDRCTFYTVPTRWRKLYIIIYKLLIFYYYADIQYYNCNIILIDTAVVNNLRCRPTSVPGYLCIITKAWYYTVECRYLALIRYYNYRVNLSTSDSKKELFTQLFTCSLQ